MKAKHQFINITTASSFELIDITQQLRNAIKQSEVSNGIALITSQHSTTALTVNEYEPRLLDDIEIFFKRIAPPEDNYMHNDIHLRDCPPDEPENAHAHLIAMMLGNSESLAVVNGEPQLGSYQSLILVELDGPRERKLSTQIMGE